MRCEIVYPLWWAGRVLGAREKLDLADLGEAAHLVAIGAMRALEAIAGPQPPEPAPLPEPPAKPAPQPLPSHVGRRRRPTEG